MNGSFVAQKQTRCIVRPGGRAETRWNRRTLPNAVAPSSTFLLYCFCRPSCWRCHGNQRCSRSQYSPRWRENGAASARLESADGGAGWDVPIWSQLGSQRSTRWRGTFTLLSLLPPPDRLHTLGKHRRSSNTSSSTLRDKIRGLSRLERYIKLNNFKEAQTSDNNNNLHRCCLMWLLFSSIKETHSRVWTQT